MYLNGGNKVDERWWGDPEGVEESPAFEDIIGRTYQRIAGRDLVQIKNVHTPLVHLCSHEL